MSERQGLHDTAQGAGPGGTAGPLEVRGHLVPGHTVWNSGRGAGEPCGDQRQGSAEVRVGVCSAGPTFLASLGSLVRQAPTWGGAGTISGVGWGAEVATMWVGNDETLWLHSLDGSQGDAKGVYLDGQLWSSEQRWLQVCRWTSQVALVIKNPTC